MKTTILILLMALSLTGFAQITIGTQTWASENLNEGVMIPASQPMTDNGILEKYCYKDIEANCDIYGALYSWDEMMNYSTVEGSQGICQEGYHVPTRAEWWVLDAMFGGEPGKQVGTTGQALREVGTTHWVKAPVTGLDLFGFAALGTGYKYGMGYNMLKYNGYFWTSSTAESNETWAWFRNISFARTALTEYRAYKTDFSFYKASYLPVRCIQNP
jgi:uncharacterized protein (TIGR02145 family)